MFSLKTILTTGLGLMLGTITGWGTTSVFNFNAIIDALTKNWGLGLDNLSQN